MNSFALRLRSLLLRPSHAASAETPTHPFDAAHGVDTSGLYYADKLPTGHAHDRYSEGYYATAPSLFQGLMAEWQATLANGKAGLPAVGLALGDYSFIDLGCGKGRVVLMASEYRFRTVIGVELNAGLVRVARRNVRRWMRAQSRDGRAACQDVRVERGDVLGLELPDGPVVLFLFNSFGEEMVRALMEKLARAADARAAAGIAGPIDLLYVHPDHDALVAAMPGVELLRCAEIAFSEEDAGADVFGVSSDVCSIYRMAG
jgi:SAM-dependent methyltransferase